MKPFNLADAKAGHPVQAGEYPATIVKFDMRTDPLLLVVVHQGQHDVVRRYDEFGCSRGNGALYMAPVGKLNGRDVYPGDIINGKSVPHDQPFNADDWRPMVETRMSAEELRDVETSVHEYFHCLRSIANAALKHAVDNGYLVVPDSEREMRIANRFYSIGWRDGLLSPEPYTPLTDAYAAAELAKVK